ncbi:MAG: hypothetical protein E3J64_03630 [Anaerolineales bacterium]|nr:MAG: hypothetical protein E3J64_03630 [Anaerolineales bacterium]
MSGRLRRDLCWLFLLSLGVRLAVAVLVQRPGYMDTAYYAAGAERVGAGSGLSEPYLWHYLDEAAGLPHDAFLYWMPLPSLLAAPLAALWPGSFLALQMPFVALSALLPPVAFWLAWRLAERRRSAWAAGLFTLFSGFFFPYWTLPETFAPFALFGALALCLATRRSAEASGPGRRADLAVSMGTGGLIGLAHLTRPDGPLLLVVILGAVLLRSRPGADGRSRRLRQAIKEALLILSGYLAVMAPWFARNLAVAGTLLPTAGTKTLWLRSYDDIFCFGCDLSLGSYLEWGWGNILQSKLWALGLNLQRLLAENCLIVLFPFAVVGMIRLRRNRVFAMAGAYLLLALLFHSLAFTLPGPRGGFFHASSAALPMVFAAASEGLEAAVRWAGRRRRWQLEQAQRVFAAAAVIGAVGLSLYAAAIRLGAWRTADSVYSEIEDCLAAEGNEASVVMVNNPPAYWYHTGRSAVAVPNGDIEMTLAAAERYGASHLVLDENRPQLLVPLYDGRETDGHLELVCSLGRTIVFRVNQ